MTNTGRKVKRSRHTGWQKSDLFAELEYSKELSSFIRNIEYQNYDIFCIKRRVNYSELYIYT